MYSIYHMYIMFFFGFVLGLLTAFIIAFTVSNWILNKVKEATASGLDKIEKAIIKWRGI